MLNVPLERSSGQRFVGDTSQGTTFQSGPCREETSYRVLPVDQSAGSIDQFSNGRIDVAATEHDRHGRSNSFVLISVPLIDCASGRVKVIRPERATVATVS